MNLDGLNPAVDPPRVDVIVSVAFNPAHMSRMRSSTVLSIHAIILREFIS